MVIAALLCVAILLAAWVLAPEGRVAPASTEPEGDAIPIAI